MQAFLLIGDPSSAVQEAQSALSLYPDETLVFEWAIRSLAAAGEDSEMMKVWERFQAHNAERSIEQELLEEMCWGILKKGREAGGLSSQVICLIGAALTQDMRAVPFLLEAMRHTNAHIRAIAVELAGFYGDHPLREEIRRLFHQEKVPDVRVDVLRTLGQLELEDFLPDLIQCVANPKTGPKEKLAAIEAIVQMRDCIGKEELKILAESSRAGLRQLACEVISMCEMQEESALLQPLMHDPQPEVCAAALKSWGLLRQPIDLEIEHLAVEALDPLVGITAAWVWLLNDPQDGEKGLIKWLEDERPHVRARAAAAVAASGPYGTALAKKYLKQTNDPYVQINLALGLAWQREACTEVCAVLEKALHSLPDKWMHDEDGLFNPLLKSTLSHNPTIPNYPEVVNQTVRLELLNLLAILEYPGALDAIKNFLKERKWGVTGLAAETLLGEGDETALELVRTLLKDPDKEIRIEAALVLASWGRDAAAIETLLEVYPKAERQLQLKILESLGRVGDKKVLPFLLERLKEPSLMLRMVAASIVIQILNH